MKKNVKYKTVKIQHIPYIIMTDIKFQIVCFRLHLPHAHTNITI